MFHCVLCIANVVCYMMQQLVQQSMQQLMQHACSVLCMNAAASKQVMFLCTQLAASTLIVTGEIKQVQVCVLLRHVLRL